MINYKILAEKQLVVLCFDGDITPEIVMSFIRDLVKNPDYNPEYKSIVDLRNCNLVYSMEGMKRTLEYMATANGFVAKRKTAYITSSSGHVVPPMLMNTGAYKFPMDIKVLSTVETALSWLALDDFTAEEYQRVLQSICNC